MALLEEAKAIELLALLLEATANELLALLLEVAAKELDLLPDDATRLELAAELNLLDELAAMELATELDLLELARLELSATLDLLLEETPTLEFTGELDATFAAELIGRTSGVELEEDGAVATELLELDIGTMELMLLELTIVLELELNWVSLDAIELCTEEVLEAWLDDELLSMGVSASSALLNELDELVPSPSTPAAPPQAVRIIEKIMPHKGSLALFSAKESIFLYH